jgi:hypothetical protein
MHALHGFKRVAVGHNRKPTVLLGDSAHRPTEQIDQ